MLWQMVPLWPNILVTRQWLKKDGKDQEWGAAGGVFLFQQKIPEAFKKEVWSLYLFNPFLPRVYIPSLWGWEKSTQERGQGKFSSL